MVFEVEHDADGKVVEFNIEATDNFDENVKIEQVRGLPSGSLFEADTAYHQEFRAIDASGNFTEMDFKITINRKEKPIELEILEHDWNFRITSIKTEQIWTDWNAIPNPTNYDRIEVQAREQGQSLWKINGTNTTDDADDITVGLSKDTDYEMRLVLFNNEDKEVSISNILSFTTGGAVVEPEPTPEEPPVVVDPKPTPTPDNPIETDEEALDMAQKILDFLKKKSSLIAIGVIAVIILLIILL